MSAIRQAQLNQQNAADSQELKALKDEMAAYQAQKQNQQSYETGRAEGSALADQSWWDILFGGLQFRGPNDRFIEKNPELNTPRPSQDVSAMVETQPARTIDVTADLQRRLGN